MCVYISGNSGRNKPFNVIPKSPFKLKGSFFFLLLLLTEKQKETMYTRMMRLLYERVGVYIEDFRFQPEETTVEPEEPLSAKR